MSYFLEKSPLFAVSSGMLQDVLWWKMIARHHYEVHRTAGMRRVFEAFSKLWQFSVSEPFSPPAAGNASR